MAHLDRDLVEGLGRVGVALDGVLRHHVGIGAVLGMGLGHGEIHLGAAVAGLDLGRDVLSAAGDGEAHGGSGFALGLLPHLGDGERNGDLGHFQGAEFVLGGIDGVVGFLGGAVKGDGVGVLRRARVGDGAGGGHGSGLAIEQAVDPGCQLGALDLGGAALQGLAVIGLGGVAGGDGQRGRGDGQGTLLQLDVCEDIRHVCSFGVEDGVVSDFVVLAIVSHMDDVLAAGGHSLEGEALGQAGGRDLLLAGAVAGEGRAVVDLLIGRRGEGDLGVVLGDRQGAELFLNGVVVLIDAAPVLDAVGVVAGAHFGLRTGGGDFDLALIRSDQAGDAGLVLGQRLSIVRLGVAAGGDGDFLGQDLQAAGTDVEADAVVDVLRQTAVAQGEGVVVLIGVGLLDGHIAKAGRIRVMHKAVLRKEGGPDRVQVFFLVLGMADLHVIRNAFAAVGEAGFAGQAVVDLADPAVRLHTDSDVDLQHLDGAVEIMDLVVIAVPADAFDDCGGGRYHADARVLAAGLAALGLRVSVIAQGDVFEGMAAHQAFDLYLTVQLVRQGPKRAVILLADAVGGDGQTPLIAQGEHQFVTRGVVRGLGIGQRRAFHGLVQLPIRHRRAGQRVGVAFLQRRGIRVGNGLPVHVDEVHGDGGAAELGVVEHHNVLALIRAQGQGFLLGVREVLLAVDLHGYGSGDDGIGVRILRSFIGRMHPLALVGGIGGLRAVVQHIIHRVADFARLLHIDEGDLVGAGLECNGFAGHIRAVAGDGDRLFGDLTAHHVVGVAHRSGGRQLLARVAHIEDRVAQRLQRPVGIEGDVRGDGRGPVVRIPVLCEPADEAVAGLGGIGGLRRSLVFLHALGFDGRRAAVQLKAHRVGGGDPLGVEDQFAVGHFVKGVFCPQALIRVPTAPGVVAVHPALIRGGRPDVGGLVDVGAEFYVFDQFNPGSEIFVLDGISLSVIIEVPGVILVGTLSCALALIPHIAVDGVVVITVTAPAFPGLAVQAGLGVLVIVRVFEVDVQRIGGIAGSPGRCIGHGRGVAIRQKIFRYVALYSIFDIARGVALF